MLETQKNRRKEGRGEWARRILLNSARSSDNNNNDNNENTAIGHNHSFQRAGSNIEREIHRGYRPVLLYAFVFILGFYLRGHGGSISQLVSEWLFTLAFLYEGTYCIRNFVHCREAHCVVTGTGWTLIGLLYLSSTLQIIPYGDWGTYWLGFFLVYIAGFSFQCAYYSIKRTIFMR